jgi:hypothetical protein
MVVGFCTFFYHLYFDIFVLTLFKIYNIYIYYIYIYWFNKILNLGNYIKSDSMNVRFTQPKGIVLSIFSALPQHWNLCTTSERTAASKTMLHPVLPSAPKQMALRWTNPTLPLPGFRALTPADGHHQVVYWTWRYPKGFYGICINRNHIPEKKKWKKFMQDFNHFGHFHFGISAMWVCPLTGLFP